MEREKKVFCWTCGVGGRKHTPDCDYSVIQTIKAPEEPPPFCGFEEFIDDGGVQMRNCCECGQGWLCDATTHITGTCPNCGASGLVSSQEVDKPILQKAIEDKEYHKIPEEKYLPKSEINLIPSKEEFIENFREKFPIKIYDKVPAIEKNLLISRVPIPTLEKISPFTISSPE